MSSALIHVTEDGPTGVHLVTTFDPPLTAEMRENPDLMPLTHWIACVALDAAIGERDEGTEPEFEVQ